MKITNYKSSSISQKTQVSTSKAIENNLKDGQIEGSVSRENGKTLLELANGEKIEVKLQADVPMGKAMTFSAFKNAAGEIILKLSPATQKSIIMDNLVRTLQLPDTPQMKELISLFMSKSLPLDRQDLIKANFAVKTFDLPAQTITNLAEKSLNLTSGQLEIAKNLQQNGTLPLAQNISDLIELLPNQKVLEFLANKLNLPTNNAATTATPANAATTATPANAATTATSANAATTATPANAATTATPANAATTATPANAATTATPANAATTATPANAVPTTTAANATPTTTAANAATNATAANAATNATLSDAVKELLFGTEVESFADIKLDDAVRDLNELVDVIEEVVEELDEANRAVPREQLDVIKEQVEVINKLEQANFEFISPLLHSQIEKGTVHFFEEKSGGGGRHKGGLYIVVALDMDSLEHLEFHIHKFDKQLDIQIYVENDHIKSYLTSYAGSFMKVVEEAGFVTSNLRIDSMEQKELKRETTAMLSNFDFRV